MNLKKVLGFTLIFIGLSNFVLLPASGAPLEVKVHFDSFPPYLILNGDKRSGIGVDLVEIMNDFQSNYRFSFVTSPAMRRFQLFKNGSYDISMFDHLHWGWNVDEVDSTDVFLHGGEKYVALAKPNRGQEYFEVFHGKKIGAFLGYHYGLASFNNDPKTLLETYNIELTSSHEGNLLKLLNGRIDMVILTDAFLSRWLVLHPQNKGNLLISEKWDQQYHFVMVVRKGTTPSAQELTELLNEMKRAGALVLLWQKYGVTPYAY
ncbi:MAG: ABC transporter substrate-binding protein [Bermanella sp.]